MVKPLWVGVQHVMPLVYDDSLSYYETLCKVVAKLNETICAYNGHDQAIKAYINNLLAVFKGEWLQLLNAEILSQQKWVSDTIDTNNQQVRDALLANQQLVNQMVADAVKNINNMIADQNSRVDIAIQDIQHKVNDQLFNNKQQMDALRAYVNDSVNSLNEYMTKQFAVLSKLITSTNNATVMWVTSEIQKLHDEIPSITSVQVRNPITGQIGTIQDVLDDMYSSLRYFSLTAAEYDTMHLEADTYDEKKLTAQEYDIYAQEFLYPHLALFNFHDPWSGDINRTVDIVYHMMDYLRGQAMTADSYDQSQYTAIDYDNAQLSAYDYDWIGV